MTCLRWKLWGALFVGAVLVLTPTAAVAAPYPPPTEEGSGNVSPSRVQAGSCVTFGGTGFAPSTTVTIRDSVDDSPGGIVGTATTDAQGRFSTQVCFDAGAQLGRHRLTGTGIGAGGGALTVSAIVFVEGLSQTGSGGGSPDGSGDGGGFLGGLPRTGFAGSVIALGGIVLVGAGSALLLASERRHRNRRRVAA